MPSAPHSATPRLARLIFLLPALVPVLLAAWIDHPAAFLLLLLAQPLYLAAAASVLGEAAEPDFRALVLRRGVPFLLLLAAYAMLVAMLVGVPLVRLAQQASVFNAAALSVGVVLCTLALLRWWPAFGLVFLWDDAYPQAPEGSWSATAVRRSLAFARHLTGEHDPWFSSGLPVALALLAVVAGALGLTGLAGVVPSELRIGALWVWALLLCPLAHGLLVDRCRRMLVDAEEDEVPDPAAAEALAVAAAPAPELPPADPATRNAQVLAAAAANQIDLALTLLRAGASADAQPGPYDRDQRSLAIIAATAPDLRLMRELIQRGVDVNRPVAGLTPLLAATRDSYSGRPEAVMTLVTNGADTRAADAEGNTALHLAALSREAGVAAILLDAGADTGAVNRDGLTPLGVACAAGNESVAALLLSRGAATAPARAVPPLIAACAGAQDAPAVVRLLVRQRAATDAVDRLGRTALHAAALHGHAEMADALLAAGAPIDARDAQGVTATMEAARAGANRVLQRLVFRKPAIDLVDQAGRTALSIACASRKANEETVRLLLALGADPSIAGNDGRRPIDHAVAGGRWPLVALIDPDYPLPHALQDPELAPDGAPGDGTPRTDLLTAALRHGRAGIAEELLALPPGMGEAELASVFVALAAAGAPRTAFEWLLDHGLDPDRPGTEPLLHQLARARPLPLAAVEAVIDRGAACGGGALLADLLGDAETPLPLREALALRLLERGADPHAVDAQRRSLLHLAAQAGSTRLLGALLARGLDPNALDARGRGALHELAVLDEDVSVSMARELLAAGANPERAATDGQTPVGAALASGRTELTRWLSWNTGLRHPGRRLRDADLVAAAQAGDAEAVDRLLRLGLPVDARDAQGCTALLRACGGGHLAIAALLLDRGADPMLAASTGATALSAAVSARRENAVRLLLERGVDPGRRLPGAITPLMVACALGLTAVARALIEHRADTAAVDESGNSALHAAAQFVFASPDTERARELLRLLLASGVPVDGRNRAGQTPLLLLLGARAPAATPPGQRALPELLQLLLSAGADLDVQDERGVSVLHAAAMHGCLDVAQALLRAGADPRRVDRLGRTAHEIALMLGFADVSGELRRAEARRGPG